MPKNASRDGVQKEGPKLDFVGHSTPLPTLSKTRIAAMRHKLAAGAGLCAVIAALWILLSDRLLMATVQDPNIVKHIQTYREWLLVIVTGGLLYVTLRGRLQRRKLELAVSQHSKAVLRDSQLRLAGVIDAAMDAIISVDDEQRIVLFNRAAERVFGRAAQAALGQPLEQFIPERFRAAHAEHIRQFGRSGESSRRMGALGAIAGLRADGREFPLEASISQSEIGGKKLFTVILRDVTERKLAEEESRRNLESIRTLHEISTAITSTLDIQGVLNTLLEKLETFVPIVSASTIRLLKPVGGTLNSLACRGLDREDWLARENRGPIGGRARRVVDSGAPIVIRNIETGSATESRGLFRKYGFVSYLGVPLITHNEIVGVLGLYTRREHEFSASEIDFVNALAGQAAIAVHNAQLFEAVKRANEEATALREINVAITSSLDLETQITVLFDKMLQLFSNCALTLRLLNRKNGAFEPLACRNIDERDWKSMMPAIGKGGPHHVVMSRSFVAIVDAQDDPRIVFPEFLRRNGLVSYLGVPLIFQNEVIGVLAVFTRERHDFTTGETDFMTRLGEEAAIAIHNSQLYERVQLQARDLAIASQVKDDFLSVISHELRTPLNITMGYAGLMKDGLLGEVTLEQRGALQKVLNQSADQLRMINDILLATHLESRAMVVDRERIDLSDVFKSLKSDFSAIHSEDQPELVWEYPAEPLLTVTDSRKLRQIVQNLVSNALKFTERGRITVSSRMVGAPPGQIPASDGKSDIAAARAAWIEIKVSDTGIGIPPDKLEVIFEKFRQLDSSTTRLYGGLGLGLFIVQQLTEILGGKITVESELDHGSTFTVTIPVGT